MVDPNQDHSAPGIFEDQLALAIAAQGPLNPRSAYLKELIQILEDYTQNLKN